MKPCLLLALLLLLLSRGVSAQVPAPWTAQDLGSPAIAGTTIESAGTWTVTAAGADIWAASDQFRFIAQPLTGDGEIIARVDGLVNTSTFAKAGVMIRGSTAVGAQNVLAYLSGGQGLISSRRAAVNGATSSTSSTLVAGVAPQWVRITRVGNVFTAYRSSTGTAPWTVLAAAVTIAMPANALAGLAVTSQNAGMLTTAIFSNVSVTPTVAAPLPPTVTSLAPTSGLSGSSVVITGTNFGATQGASTVTFNGLLATPTAWSVSSLAVAVPVGATTGNVVVTVGGLATAGRLFTVVPTPPTGVTITASSQIVWDEMGADITTLGTYVYTAYVDTVKGPTLPSTCAVVGAMQFTCTSPVPLASLVVGTHTIYVTATWNGQESGPSNVVLATVDPIATVTTVVLTGITTAATFTATVTSAAGTPTGSIAFRDNGVPLLAMPVSPLGTVTWTVMNVALGPHDWTATYTGTGAFASSVSPTLATVVTITAP